MDRSGAVYASACIYAVFRIERLGRMQEKIESLRQQHDAAEEMAAAIMLRIAAYRDEYDAVPIAGMIGKLNALLRVHFAYEDTILYPLMMTSGDAEAAATAHLFATETGSLAPQFEDFARRFSGPTAIKSMFEPFREEAMILLAALGARIERENDLLYPLAERAALSRAA
jgi:iron-sulfur cluster repair protein YtfE (RIC family)